MIGPVLRMVNAVHHQVTLTWISVGKRWREGWGWVGEGCQGSRGYDEGVIVCIAFSVNRF